MRPGWKTTEFWITFIAQIINGLIQSGMLGDGTQLVKLFSFAAATLTAIVYAITRAQLKQTHSDNELATVGKDPQAGFMRLDTVLMILLTGALIAVIASSACGSLKSDAKHAGNSFVDCMKPDIAPTAKELGSVLLKSVPAVLSDTGKVDRAGFKALTDGLTTDAAGCAIASVVAELSKPRGTDTQATPLTVDAADLQSAWLDVDRAQFGGRTFQVK